MWYPPEDQPNRHEHHEDQCNYPFHFFLLCVSPVRLCSGSFSFPPILQLSEGKSHTSQMPKPALAREEPRLC
jgi:hypothetical protein